MCNNLWVFFQVPEMSSMAKNMLMTMMDMMALETRRGQDQRKIKQRNLKGTYWAFLLFGWPSTGVKMLLINDILQNCGLGIVLRVVVKFPAKWVGIESTLCAMSRNGYVLDFPKQETLKKELDVLISAEEQDSLNESTNYFVLYFL